jgi:hypothetical protein
MKVDRLSVVGSRARFLQVAAVGAVLLTSPLGAQARPSNVCAEFQRALDASEKTMSALYVEGVTDNSAPRATLRAQQTANELQEVQINLLLMQQNHCSLPTRPVDPLAYMLNALQCQNERMRVAPTAETTCNQDMWRRADEGATSPAVPRPPASGTPKP